MFGRTKITCSLSESELSPENIALVLQDVLPIHIKNSQQIEFLRKVVKGDQSVYNKQKKYRSEINNKFVENHVQHAIAFKVGYVFDGIQYVQVASEADSVKAEGNGIEEEMVSEVNILNTHFRNNEKSSKDAELEHEVYTSGVCPRIIIGNKDKNNPFEIHNLDGTQAFVVYSSGVRGERLFSVYMWVKRDYTTKETTLYIEVITKKNKYTYKMLYGIYSEYSFKKEFPIPQYIPEQSPLRESNVWGEIPIFEYTFNKDRQSLTEIMLDSQDYLNQLASSEMDDVQQFVQSFIALINAQIDKATFAEVKEEGLFQFMSKENGNKADIKVISNKLDYAGTRILYENRYEKMLINAGVPLLNTSGGGGDTGVARLTDNGWTMADTKARQDELGFKKSEQPLLKFVIKILKSNKVVQDLDTSNIEIKFARNKTDNIQTKVQSLQGLINSGIHPLKAMETVDLFGDPSEVYSASVKFYGEDFYRGGVDVADYERLKELEFQLKNSDVEDDNETTVTEENIEEISQTTTE